MATWPSESTLFNTSITGSDANPLMKAWLQTTKQLIGAVAPEIKTISNGSIAPTRASILVDTEGGAAADTLSVIATSGLHDGVAIMLRAADSSRTVTVQHSTVQGGLATFDAQNVNLSTQWPLFFSLSGGRWIELPGGLRALRAASTVATTDAPGIVQLSNAVNSTSEALAATSKAVKTAYDKANEAVGTVSAAASVVTAALLGHVAREKKFIQPLSNARSGFIFKGGTYITLTIPDSNNVPQDIVFGSKTDVIFNDARQLLDTGTSFNAGRDYYIYAVLNESANKEILNPINLVVSLNSTYPVGYNADNSRKIGGFHALCANVGSISGHPLSGFIAGEILPKSFWCLTHRPAICGPEGMVFLENFDVWVDIYMQSGTEVNTASVYNGTVTKSRSWDSHAEDLAKVGKRMLQDTEFTMAAWGTQPHQAVKGSADPVTTGGKLNNTDRRIISNIGCEDMCGCYYTWLNGVGASGGSGWGSMKPNDQGSIFGASLALMAGGDWANGYYSGPRCRDGFNGRMTLRSSLSSRGAARTI